VLGGVIFALVVIYALVRTDAYRRARAGRAIALRVDPYLKGLHTLEGSAGAGARGDGGEGGEGDGEGEGGEGEGRERHPLLHQQPHFAINLDDDMLVSEGNAVVVVVVVCVRL
jgi:hypothetical protein